MPASRFDTDRLLVFFRRQPPGMMVAISLLLVVLLGLGDLLSGPEVAFAVFYLIPISFSIGVITCPEAPEDSEVLLQQVDEMMYKAKRGGKNAIHHQNLAPAE